MLVYKLKMWMTPNEDGSARWRDFYFDVHQLIGWHVPIKEEEEEDDAINIFFSGEELTIKQEPHILKYLADNFGKNAIKNE